MGCGSTKNLHAVEPKNASGGPRNSAPLDPHKVKLLRKLSEANFDIVTAIKNYSINPEEDYFRKHYKNNTTILNSEIATIKRCVELLSSVDWFKDPDFGPEVGGELCLYWEGKAPNPHFPDPANIEWRSPSDWIPDAKFFDESISSNDVVQGQLGDCWLIGALSVLATRDELLTGGVRNLRDVSQINLSNAGGLSKGVYPPLFHNFAREGLYVLKFYKDSAPRWVIIDDRLPVFKGVKPQYVFGHCKNESEQWVALIEKGYAKLHGCYQALSGGLIDDGLVDLTGLVSEKMKVDEEEFNPLWEKMLTSRKWGTLMGCSIEGEGIESEVMYEGRPTGLLAGHAYGLLDVMYVENPSASKERHRLLRIRNPWGLKEWTGMWSDGSEKLQNNYSLVQKELVKLGKDEKFDPNKNDGTFLMRFKDWRTHFDNLFMCVDFTEEWWGQRFGGEWTQQNSGGIPTNNSVEAAQNWAKNPQFVLELKSKTETFISMVQEDGRAFKGSEFPFPEKIKTACFTVMKLEAGQSRVEAFDASKIVKLSVLKQHREVHLRLNLDPGRYVIVPATKTAGEVGKFWLSLYFDRPKSEVVTYHAEEQSNHGRDIAEEEEVRGKNITPGQLKIAKELLSYLVTL